MNTPESIQCECRAGCAACCTVISISSPLPGMPNGKPAGVRCVNLDDSNNCTIHNTNQYPAICRSFPADLEMCGLNNAHAYRYIEELERKTRPDSSDNEIRE